MTACTSSDYLAPVVNKNYNIDKSITSTRIITVYEGDSLYSISKREGVSIRSIIKANKLEPPFTLYKGEKIIIAEPKVHIVKKGHTLYDIANCFNVSILDIMKMNQLLKSDKIYEGDKLFIPITPNNVKAKCSNIKKTIANNNLNKSKEVINSSKYSYMWPVKGKIISKFGLLAKGLRNDGINISADKGKPVLAVESGKIVYAGNEIQAFGNLILIKHYNNKTSAYAHLEKINVKKGESVNKGQIIALVGNSGKVSTPQLHFEIRDKDGPLDPLKYLPQ
ncbi:MAG: Murein hydrolase activator NlpD [Alphaproteobacteria bacterium MarineAlpha9_Bin3]|nr:MAG: Murein hydrolase activator NlpD [Alphaproteobacteria bacterium MarineAlpha9_Bin3]|tara:strand:+ start:296 stop:1132 length:837 start_codon:yes stop_codon:yes gene_type:complete